MTRFSSLFRSMGTSETAEDAMDSCSRDEQQFSLLFVDDEQGVLSAMRRIFIEENYEIITASSADQALSILEEKQVHLIVSDHRMPGTSGAELLKTVKERWPQIIRIMLTGHADVNSIMGAVQDGAVYKFITKPWNDEDLRLTVSLALQQYLLMHENRRLREISRQQQEKIQTYISILDENRGMMGKILIRSGIICEEQLAHARQNSTEGEFLSDTLVRVGATTESKILLAMQQELNVEYIDLREARLQKPVVRILPREFCEKNRILPLKLENQQLHLAMADPSDICKCDNIAMVTGLKVVPLLAGSSEIISQLKSVYGERNQEIMTETEYFSDLEPLDEIDIILDEEDSNTSITELIGSAEVPPVIRIVNAIISEALRYRASDIHIEPKTKYTLIRYRIDGLLHGKIRIPLDLHPSVVSRIKILSKLDISERRRPQDGRITVKTGTRIVDMRVSCLPTINGEKLVLRILDKNAAIKSLKDLGVLDSDLQRLQIITRKPQGVIIATGPTGSGKTTLLYSILGSIMDLNKNFETIEEPVEYFLEEANQVAVKEKIGLTFAQILRSTLRQDPDIIMVGEMRDQETADVAFKAALTGHLVLSTLHTNGTVASITRLMDMEIKPYIIASSLQGIIAQRLVRKVCTNCSQEVDPDPELLKLLKAPDDFSAGQVHRGAGCSKCNSSGYLGRLGIFELFVMTDDYRQIIHDGYREGELLQMARADGMHTLIEDGLEKVRQGLTTLEELFRVLGPQLGAERVCEHCGRAIDARFIFCPHCGTFRRNYCQSCRLPLENTWVNCPFCGRAKEQKSTNSVL